MKRLVMLTSGSLLVFGLSHIPSIVSPSTETQLPVPATHALSAAGSVVSSSVAIAPGSGPATHTPTWVGQFAELDKAEDNGSEVDQLKGLLRVVESVPAAERPMALETLCTDQRPAAVTCSILLVRRWAEQDPRAASAWVESHLHGPHAERLLEPTAIAWADQDLNSACGWLRGLPDSSAKQRASLVLAYEAARAEPLVALELARSVTSSRERDDLLIHAMSQWGLSDASAATEWALQVEPVELRHRLLTAAVVAQAEQDGANAGSLLAELLPAGRQQDLAAVATVQRWAQQSPEAAAAWVAQFPDIPARAPALDNLLAVWVAREPEAARQWADSLPAGSLHDAAATAVDRRLAAAGKQSSVSVTSVALPGAGD